jgi:hypothetical protein
MLAKHHQKVGQSSSIHFFGMCSAQSMQVMNLKVEKAGSLVEKLALG